MSVRNYHAMAGLLIGHDVDGANPVGYLSGQVGSITATTNTSGAVVNTYRPKPYGQRLAKTGVGADPPFEWTGNSGSRRTGLSHAEQYNQARHYDSITTRWTTVDPLWPEEPKYLYCYASPVLFIDPSGLCAIAPIRPFVNPLQGPIFRDMVLNPKIGAPRPIGDGGRGVYDPGGGVGSGWSLFDDLFPGGRRKRIWPPCRVAPEVYEKARQKGLQVPKFLPGYWSMDILLDHDRLCEELEQRKNVVCPGMDKKGKFRECKGPGHNVKITKKMCDEWSKNEKLWADCCETRQAELDWDCIKKIDLIVGHKKAADSCKGARNFCGTLFRRHCQSP